MPTLSSHKPHRWCTGPDPVLHQQYIAWYRGRNLARHRHETWLLTFDEFLGAWQGHWHQRGRGRRDLGLTRCDPDLAWCADNVELITREEHNRRITARRSR